MSYTSCLYHIVIRTKRSEPTITAAYEREVYAYIFTLIKSYGCIMQRARNRGEREISIARHGTASLSEADSQGKATRPRPQAAATPCLGLWRACLSEALIPHLTYSLGNCTRVEGT